MNPLHPFLPQEPGLRAHVARVSALAIRAGKFLGYSPSQLTALESAALLHHHPVDPGETEAASRLFEDLGIQMPFEIAPLPDAADRILRVLRGGDRPSDPFLVDAAALVESANLFDEQMENLPYEELSVRDSVGDLLATGILSPAFVQALEAFRVVAEDQILEGVKELPVFPRAALEALRLAGDPESGLREMEQAVSKDAVLAGEIVQLANSALFGASHPVHTIAAALSRVGSIAAGKMIAAAAVRRCFASSNLRQLWSHSCETGENAALIAGDCGGMPVGQAYLTGLLHDAGRLAYEICPAAAPLRAWMEAGFPAAYAEFLVSGTDHAEVGAAIMQAWHLPDEIVEAVRFHHRPEMTASRLAAVIYAAEDVDEALPSCARDRIASKRLDTDQIRQMRAVG